MQTHEFAESVQHGLRIPHVNQDPAAQRATPDVRTERLGTTDEERRPAARQPARTPRSYGAGF